VARLRRWSVPLVAALGAAAAVLPALAQGDGPPASASFTAVDNLWVLAGSPGTRATIATGGTVSFSYPSGSNTHDVVFPSAQPSSCAMTSGTSANPVPPLPDPPQGPGWAGTCTFTVPGTYTFYCRVHPDSMVGSIVVQDPPPATVPTTTTDTAPVVVSPPPADTTPATTVVPVAPRPAAIGSVTVAKVQRGSVLKGSLVVGQAGRLSLAALAPRSAVVSTAAVRLTTVGRVAARTVAAGRRSFSIKLTATGRRALRRHGRLTITVRVTLAGASGTVTRDTTGIALRAPRG
jgi:plastocyanin